MAAINHTNVKISRGAHIWEWLAMANADAPDALGDGDGAVAFADKTVQFDSAAWGGATATLEGSNDGTSWFGLSDPQGAAISMTVNGLVAVLENPRYIKPVLSGGAASSINCRLVGRAIIQLF